MTMRIGGEGTLDETFFTEAELIDRYVGGRLWVSGYNVVGQLGDNTIVTKSSPVQTIVGGTNWKQVSASGGSNARIGGIKTDGTLWLWGGNTDGTLGDNTIAHKSSPVQTVAVGSNWKQVSLGGGSNGGCTAAIKTDGTLWLWGANILGQLGDNTSANKSSPVQTVAGGNNWKFVEGDKGTGNGLTAALKTDGTLWVWGENLGGGLGTSEATTVKKSSPVQTVAGGSNWKYLACGVSIVGGIKTDGSLWIWGANALYGMLGDNTLAPKSSPVQTVAGGTNWKQVALSEFVSAAIKTDGTLWAWGRGTSGALGDNTIAHKSSPVQTVAGGTNWKQVSANTNSGGDTIAGAIKTDSTLWMWGHGADGNLGDSSLLKRSSPVQTVAGGTIWKQASVGGRTLAALTYSDQ